MEFKVSTLLKDLSREEFTQLESYLRQRNIPGRDEKAIQLLTTTFENHVNRERPYLKFTHGDCGPFAELLWKNCRSRFEVNQNATNTALIQMGIKQQSNWEPGQKEAALLKGIQANLKELDTNIKKTKDLIAAKEKKKQSTSKESAWLHEYSQGKQEIVKQRNLFQRWVQNPLEAITAELVLSLDSVTKKLNMLTTESEGKIELVGGCTQERRDLVSTLDEGARTLLDRYGEPLTAVPYERMVGTGLRDPTQGVFFKLAFDELQVTSLGREWSAIRYLYPNTLDETTLPMFHAIATQDKDLFAQTAPKITNWNAKDSLGVSLIHYAASVQDPFFLHEIIRNNADLYAVDNQGFTAMHYAAREEVVSSLQLLARSAPVLLNTPSQAGESPLYMAVQNNRLSSVRFFIESKVDLTSPAKHGMNALLCALHHGFEEIALELLDTHAFDLDYPINGKAAIHMAIEMKLENALAELVRQGANINKTIKGRYRPIDIAIAVDWLQGVKILASTQNIKLDHLKLALDRQNEVTRYLNGVVGSRTGQLLPLPTTSSAASQPITHSNSAFNPQNVWKEINCGFEQAAYIRNSLDGPPKNVNADLTELNSRIAQIGASLQNDHARDPRLQQSYASLKFQAKVLKALIKDQTEK